MVIDARDKTSKPYTVSKNNITMLNEPDEFQVTALEDIKNVTIVGPKSSIDALNADGIYAEVDLSTIELSEGRQEVTARVYVRSFNDCWAYSTYKVPIQIKQKLSDGFLDPSF